jgi:hypothetical protein
MSGHELHQASFSGFRADRYSKEESEPETKEPDTVLPPSKNVKIEDVEGQ